MTSAAGDGRHRLLRKQVLRATRPDGSLDLERLLAQVSAAYDDEERDRQRIDHANRLMAEEIEQAQRQLQETVASLRVQNARFDAALQNMVQGLCLFDRERRLVIANRRFHEMFGLEDTSLLGLPLVEVVRLCRSAAPGHAADDESEGLLALALNPQRDVLQQERADGRVIVVVHEPMGDGGFVQTFEDVTARRAADAKLAHLASHDALTNLPNRTLLADRLEQAIVRARDADAGQGCALMYLDLDRFKAVNDSLGHPAGDRLLVEVTRRLVQLMRSTDTVARCGGDEFAIVVSGVSEPTELAGLAQRLVQALEQPFDLDGQAAVIGASVGIARAPLDGSDAVTLTRRADLALYQAKSAGRGRYCFFEPGMDMAARGRREIEIDLRRALEREEFELHYQPLVDIATRQVTGCEALLRWRSPERGLLPPDRFIPLAEELGLIVPIGEWVLQRACRDAAGWRLPLRLAVNVSVRQIHLGTALVHTVQRALASAGLAAERLELEITETVLMARNDHTFGTLMALRELGVRIVMDDFGVGYSSLANLRSFPFDKVKIDRSFVKEIGRRADAGAIVRAVSALCNSLGITSTAEGVETDEQLAGVAAERCTQAQGFLFSRPVPSDQLPALLERLCPPTHAVQTLPTP